MKALTLLIAFFSLTGCTRPQARTFANISPDTIQVTYAGFSGGCYAGCGAYSYTLPLLHDAPWRAPGDPVTVVTYERECWEAQDQLAKAGFKP